MPQLRELLGVRVPIGTEFLIVIAPRDSQDNRQTIAGYLLRTQDAFIVRELEPGEILTRTSGEPARYHDIAEAAKATAAA